MFRLYHKKRFTDSKEENLVIIMGGGEIQSVASTGTQNNSESTKIQCIEPAVSDLFLNKVRRFQDQIVSVLSTCYMRKQASRWRYVACHMSRGGGVYSLMK